ncbi:MAG: hypothetical protein JSS02_06875 [Planctomycetes bacterium]|nr:hypothetical protein [Planctomycetota bacterium]
MMTTDSARVIKARSPRPASAVAFNFDDLRKQCDDYAAHSRAAAEQILAEATAAAEEIRRQAYAEGYQVGQAEGQAAAEQAVELRATQIAVSQADAKIQTALPALNESVRALQLERDRWLTSWEAAAIRLSAAIAEKIIRRELERNPLTSRDMIQEALELAAGTATVQVRLNPQDFAVLQDHGQDSFRNLTTGSGTEFHPDPAISPGGCVIETRHGVVDARLETLIDRITQELLGTA